MPLNAEIQALVQAMASMGMRPVWELTPGAARAQAAQARRAQADGPVEVDDLDIPRDGADVTARRYRAATATRGTIVYLHGGGWVLGTLDSGDAFCRRLARDTGCLVVSVAYRLAPEHPFPAALEDVMATLHWAASQPARGPLVVAGESSGGNLAAAAALRAVDDGGPGIFLQVLVYPVTDHDLDRGSYRRHPDGPFVTVRDMRWFWDHYLGDPARRSDPLASPLRARDLSRLPPALVVLAGQDPVHDEGAEYARRMADDGVPVEVLRFDDMPHGFLGLAPAAASAARAAAEVAASVGARVAIASRGSGHRIGDEQGAAVDDQVDARDV